MSTEDKANEIFNNISFGYWEEKVEDLPPKIAWRLSLQTVGYILQALKFDMNISTPMKYWESVAKIIRLKYWENFALMPPKEQNDERSVATDDDQGGEAGNKKLTGEGQSQCLKRRTNNAECKELCEGCFIVYKTCGVDAVLSKWNQGKEAGETVNDDVKNLIEWLNRECPPDTDTHELSHDFAENLRKRLNLIHSISQPITTPSSDANSMINT